MASTYRDTMQHYNGTDYDTLLPKSAFPTSVKLTVAGWSSNKTQRVTSSIISADDDIIVSPARILFNTRRWRINIYLLKNPSK